MTEDPSYLFWNARAGFSRNVRRYLRKGGDPDAVDPGGYTALHIAALNGHADVAAELLTARADVEMRDAFGRTALECARKQGRTEVVDLIEARLARA